MDIENIQKEYFEKAAPPDKKKDEKSISRGFLTEAFFRFSKNKASLIAAIIILLLVIFAIFSPIVSKYSVYEKDSIYAGFPPYIPSLSKIDFSLFNGGVVYESKSAETLEELYLKGEETGMSPVIKIIERYREFVKYRGENTESYTYKLLVNKYYEVGVIYKIVSLEEFDEIIDYQNKTGIQIIYPYVKKSDLNGTKSDGGIWYQVSDNRGTPIYDNEGNVKRAYSTDKASEGREYNSIRVSGDNGQYIYSIKKSGALECRICYYNYMIFQKGFEPTYILGTNSLGQDLFCAIGVGARFSLLFSVIVSIINLIVGIIYGALEGYYGGKIDLVLDRIADILSSVPFIVVATLFSLHLADKVGIVGSILFAFVLTGWIPTAALTRGQFYRYRGREFVLAAKTVGASDRRIMFKHILLNASGVLITSAALVIPAVISSETVLQYLGIINLSDLFGTSLGTLMAQGQNSMTSAPHTMLFPTIYFSLLLVSFNLFGNGLRDAFNPESKGN